MKRNIGIIPNKNENKVLKGIRLNREEFPDFDFQFVSYQKLFEYIKSNEFFDLLLFYNLVQDTHNNICVASYELREKFDTPLLISFNKVQEEIKGRFVNEERFYLEKLLKSDINGIITTSSTDELFLFTLMKDIIAGKEEYSKIKRKVESQKDFLVFKPDYTEIGYRKP